MGFASAADGFKTANGRFEYREHRAAWFQDCDGNVVEVGQVPERS